MAPAKGEIAPWKWVETTQPEDITMTEVYQAYRLNGPALPRCPFRCVRNCKKNPYCLWGLGEKSWILNGGGENSDEDNNPEFRREEDFVGIINLGTTCYVNALLQLWFHNPILRPAILSWRPSYAEENEKYQPLCLMGQLQAMFARMKISKRSAIDPTTLIESLSLNTGEQQDAQEFAKLFMSVLSTIANEDEVSKELNRAFEGIWQYEMECKACNTKYCTKEKFTELDLCVKDVKDTSASFAKLFAEEELTGDNKYLCQNCNAKTDAIRRFHLLNLPPVLNIQLLRFIYDKDTRRKKKVTTPYCFPEFLDMSPYVQKNGSDETENLHYQLTGYLVHNGKSTSSGHYVAHIFDIRSKAWLIFNDDAVSEQKSFKSSDAKSNGLEDETSKVDKTGEYKSTGSYMLVYTRKSVIESVVPDPEIPPYLKQLIEEEDATFESEFQLTKKERENKAQYLEERKSCVENLYNLLVPEKKMEPALEDNNKENQETQDLASSTTSVSKTVPGGKRSKGKENQDASKKGNKSKDAKFEEESATTKAKEYESRYKIDDMDYIPCNWLQSWLNSTMEVVPELTTREIRCSHNKLVIPAGTCGAPYKVIPSDKADLLYVKYGKENSEYRLKGSEALCKDCVVSQCVHQRKVIELDSDFKAVQELSNKTAKKYENYRKEHETANYSHEFWIDKVWVSKNVLRRWKTLAKSSFPNPEGNGNGTEEEVQEVISDSSPTAFNEDIKCPHGNLCLDEGLRRPVCIKAWSLLHKYFPNCFVAPASSSMPCEQCQADEQKNQSTVVENRKAAEKIKEALLDLIKDRNRPKPYKSGDFYFVNDHFVRRITLFIKSPEKNESPASVENRELLCQHLKFKYPISVVDNLQRLLQPVVFVDQPKEKLDKWALAKPDEWRFIRENFSVDYTINCTVVEDEEGIPDDPAHIYEPEVCDECSSNWSAETQAELFKFVGEAVYFKPFDSEEVGESNFRENGGEVDDDDDDEDFKVVQPVSKKKRTDEVIQRRSGRSRMGKKTKKVLVSSEDTVKKLKHYLVKALAFEVLASDISLYYNGAHLSDDTATVASLGIFPGAGVFYKTERIDNDDSMDVDRYAEPETGFAGTMLQLRLDDARKNSFSLSTPSSSVGAPSATSIGEGKNGSNTNGKMDQMEDRNACNGSNSSGNASATVTSSS